jgi:hypothetical protein
MIWKSIDWKSFTATNPVHFLHPLLNIYQRFFNDWGFPYHSH